MANEQSFLEKCYRDKEGKVTIFQSPNLPLIAWLATTLLGKVISEGLVSNVLGYTAFGAIFTWAWLELFQGDNYLRRILGFIVLIASVWSRVN